MVSMLNQEFVQLFEIKRESLRAAQNRKHN